jgi:hypothetical protein
MTDPHEQHADQLITCNPDLLNTLDPLTRYRAAQTGIDRARTIQHQLGQASSDAVREMVAARPRERDQIAGEIGVSKQRLSQILAPTTGDGDQRLGLLRDALRLIVANYSTAQSVGGLNQATAAIEALHGQRRLDQVRLRGVAERLVNAARYVDKPATSAEDWEVIREGIVWAGQILDRE